MEPGHDGQCARRDDLPAEFLARYNAGPDSSAWQSPHIRTMARAAVHVSQVSGMSFEDISNKIFFRPLGMSTAPFASP